MIEGFTHVDTENPHVARGRAILKKYPEARKLMGPYLPSFYYILLITLVQLSLSSYLNTKSWTVLLIVSYLVGAFFNHALFVLLHDAGHNLIFKRSLANKFAGIAANIAQAFPTAISFRKFHYHHHIRMGEYDYDADLPFHKEAQLVSDSPIKKIIWYLLFGLIETLRPNRLKLSLWDKWVGVNFLVIVTTNILVFYFLGGKALAYLAISTFWGVGFHPLGARWIQEHYTFREDQETYSYYGPLNKLSFNVGYHNEHHDLWKISWAKLPLLRKMAPEYYDELYSHDSWTKLLWQFIFDKKITLYSRMIRKSKEKLHEAAEETISPHPDFTTTV